MRAAAAFLLLCAGCFPNSGFKYIQAKSLGGACDVTGDCQSGLFCVAGRCAAQQCQGNGDCGAGQICSSAYTCGAGSGAALSVTDVHGDVPVNGGFRVRSSLVIVGSGFAKSTAVQLVSASLSKTWDLVVTPVDASTMRAALDADAARAIIGQGGSVPMKIRVISQTAGSVARDVSLLQGEVGLPGPAGIEVALDSNITVSSAAGTSPGTIGLASVLDLSGSLGTKAVKLPLVTHLFRWEAAAISLPDSYCTIVANGSDYACDGGAISNHFAYLPCATGEVPISGGCFGAQGGSASWAITTNCIADGGLGLNNSGCMYGGGIATGWSCAAETANGQVVPVRAYVTCLKSQ